MNLRVIFFKALIIAIIMPLFSGCATFRHNNSGSVGVTKAVVAVGLGLAAGGATYYVLSGGGQTDGEAKQGLGFGLSFVISLLGGGATTYGLGEMLGLDPGPDKNWKPGDPPLKNRKMAKKWAEGELESVKEGLISGNISRSLYIRQGKAYEILEMKDRALASYKRAAAIATPDPVLNAKIQTMLREVEAQKSTDAALTLMGVILEILVHL